LDQQAEHACVGEDGEALRLRSMHLNHYHHLK
jgi:hypothetical protein